MKYFCQTADGKNLEVELTSLQDEQYQLVLDGQSETAQFADVDRLGQYSMRIGGRAFAVSIEEVSATELIVHLAGESFRIVAQDQREVTAHTLGKRKAGGGETIQAFMPGIVVKVLVDVGDVVEAGQALAVLEAMKMQNEVASEQGGEVVEILVTPGTTVAASEPLFRLKSKSDSLT